MSENLPKKESVAHKQRPLFPIADTSSTLNVLRGLDRVEVEPLALEIVSRISPFCIRVEVAGSIRRRKSTVNDIDIVVLPKPQFWVQVVKEIRHKFSAVTEKQGEKLATLYVPLASKQGKGYVEVDLYRASEGTWGILLLIRTGSAEQNIYLSSLAIRKGYHLAHSKGLTNEKGEVIASKTEQEVFQALGLDYKSPEDRELKKE